MSSVAAFLPSTHGFQFPNAWPKGTPIVVLPTPVGDLKLGDANSGLCGGMAMAAADLFYANRHPPADSSPPAGGSAQFEYLSSRLFDSWNIPQGPITFAYWAVTLDHDTGFIVDRPGVSHMTISDQIPPLKSMIDQGHPCLLGLVTVRDVTELGKCHIVLAYRYETEGSVFTTYVYDPNSPGNDSVFISLDTSSPEHSTPINHTVNIDDPIRGFFVLQYSFKDPSSIAGP
jgi:hypothetical protein